MRCVAVFTDADADAPFVTEADVAVRLPGAYLDGDAVVAALDVLFCALVADSRAEVKA